MKTLGWVLLTGCLMNTAWAEPSWLTSRGRLPTSTRSEVFLGTRSVGLGIVKVDGDPEGDNDRGTGGELLYSFWDRTVEGRGSRVFVLGGFRFAKASLALGGTLILVPEGLDLGLGPNAALNFALGGNTFHVDFALQSGAELFVRQLETRVPIRGLVSFNLQVQSFSLSLMARIGADIQPGRFFAGRGEVLLSVGWF
jgi:hypothetical protein